MDDRNGRLKIGSAGILLVVWVLVLLVVSLWFAFRFPHGRHAGNENLDGADEFGYKVKETPKPLPSTEGEREAVLKRESGIPENLKRLKKCTFDMIEHHPGNEEIVWCNCAAFYLEPKYALQVIKRLEKKAIGKDIDPEIYWSIAYISSQIAIPPTFADDAEREDFLNFFGLPEKIKFPKRDLKLAEKSVLYYRKAIDAAIESVFETAFIRSNSRVCFESWGVVRKRLLLWRMHFLR